MSLPVRYPAASARHVGALVLLVALLVVGQAHRAVAQGCSGSLQSMSPCTQSVKLPPNTVSAPLSYTITNNNPIDAATYQVTCSGTLATCNAVSPNPVVIPAHSNRNFSFTLTTGPAGGTATLTVSATGGDGDLSATIDLIVNNVRVTPKLLVVADSPSTIYSQKFAVQNLGNVTATINLTKACDSGVTACSGPTPASLVLSAGATDSASVGYTSKSEGVAGWVRLIGTDAARPTSLDTGSINVTVPSPLPPVLSAVPHNGDNRALGLCALSCFDVTVGYSTPAYTSYDTPRSATLFYSSGQASPIGELQLDVTDPSFRKANTVSLRLMKPGGTYVTFNNGTTELFFVDSSDGGATRVSAQFDTTLATGVYSYTAIVTLKWTSAPDAGINTQSSLPVTVLVVNERTSVFGAGWSLAGLQRLVFSSDSLTIGVADGAGSIARFTRPGKADVAHAAAADFSSILTNVTGGAVTGYTRTLSDGTALQYGVTGLLLAVRNRFNDSTRYHYDASSRVDSIIDPAGKTLRFVYASGKLSTITDAGGRVSQFTVDGSTGNLTTIKDPTNTVTFSGTTYDGSHRLTQRTDRRGGTWLYRYDFGGKLASDSTPFVWADSVWQRIGARYRSLGAGTLIDPASGKGTVTNRGDRVYSATIRLAVISPSGDSVRYAVDKFGAPTRVESPVLKDTVWITRDPNSRVTRTLERRRGKTVGNATAVWSGSYPQLLQSTDSLTGATVAFAYDNTFGLLTDITGNTANRKYFLESLKRWVDSSCTRSAGACTDAISRLKHDAHGRDTMAVDPQRDTSWANFDAANFRNLLFTKAGTRKTEYRYDGYGRVVRVIDPRRDSVIVSLDSLNRTRSATGPQGSTVTFGYDSIFLKAITDAKGQAYTYYRNPIGWLDSLRNANANDPDSNRVDKYEYSKLGSLKAHVNRRKQRTRLTYDIQGQLLTRTLSDGRVTTFAYDTAGLWAAGSNAEATDTVRTDSAGLAQTETSWRGGHWDSVTTSADKLGLVRSFRLASDAAGGSSLVTYGYDVNSRLDSLTVDATALTAFLYNADGMLSKLILPTLPVPDTITYAVTGAHQDYSTRHSRPAIDTVFGALYTRDSLDRIAKRYKAARDTSWTYSYDALGRLTQYQAVRDTSALTCVPDPTPPVEDGEVCTSANGQAIIGTTTFSYDTIGNPKDLGAVVVPGNRLTTYNGFTLAYDYDGNLTHKQKTGFDQTLFWNSIGQLDSVRTDQGIASDTVRFGYDASGRRVRKTVGRSSTPSCQFGPCRHYTTRYLYTGEQVVAEVDSATNTAVRVYAMYGIDAPHSVKTGGKTYFYIQEIGAAHVVGLISADSTKIKDRYRYAPFGQLEDSLESVANPLRYTGREYDKESQLYYYRARYYDQSISRFVSEDPIGLAGGINQYEYAGGDPVNANDPSGLCPHGCWQVPRLYHTDGGPPKGGSSGATHACIVGQQEYVTVERLNSNGTIVSVTNRHMENVWGQCSGGDPGGWSGTGTGGFGGGARGADAETAAEAAVAQCYDDNSLSGIAGQYSPTLGQAVSMVEIGSAFSIYTDFLATLSKLERSGVGGPKGAAAGGLRVLAKQLTELLAKGGLDAASAKVLYKALHGAADVATPAIWVVSAGTLAFNTTRYLQCKYDFFGASE